MNKGIRETIWNKYGQRCAYCGKKIKYSELQVDHIHPLRNGGTDEIENLNPSCRRCNHYKRALSLDKFRTVWLGELHTRLEKQYTIKVALDYGMIKIKPFGGKFYFEKVGTK